MARTMTAIKGVAGVTYCTVDGTPYRTDVDGIAYVNNYHSTEMAAKSGVSAATAANLTSGSNKNNHLGYGLTITVENSG